MNDRIQFAVWVFASELGVLSREQIIGWADQRIAQVDKPEWWLIEVSLTGSSGELEALINTADDAVFSRVVLLVFRTWSEGAISDKQFITCCRTIWTKAGYSSRWYEDLVWIIDEFDLVEEGVFLREESVAKLSESLSKGF